MSQTLPYKFTPEFILAKTELRERLAPILEAKLRPSQSDLSKEDAACSYVRGVAELHEKFLTSSSFPGLSRKEYLRAGICAAAEEVGRYVPARHRELESYRDFVIQQTTERAELKGLGDCEVEAETPKPILDVELINQWIEAEGYSNDELKLALKTSARTISSMRHNGRLHGRHAVTKLANLMKCDPEDLYLRRF
jgi:hypothetical protein